MNPSDVATKLCEGATFLQWIECHPGLAAWLQAFFSVAAIIAAIYVPWRIHSREMATDEKTRAAYHRILWDAVSNLRDPTAHLNAIHEFFDVDLPGQPQLDVVQSANIILQAYDRITEATAVLDELQEINRLNSFGAVNTIFLLRQQLRSILPIIEHEARILREYKTIDTVRISIGKLAGPTMKLRQATEAALEALG